ncbi:Histone chaperone ASF1B [Vitis vinifera]|uniref:Histone chaperone ASF1B n=1 Tax=Vitis vinifera TaxID=29760 RepID=A0A438DEV3_VITVI|nr:Histone chaperone ASF1B [Vitis vinifera]
MSAVNITNVAVLDNPASFLKPFQFEITYECLTPLADEGKECQIGCLHFLAKQTAHYDQNCYAGQPVGFVVL